MLLAGIKYDLDFIYQTINKVLTVKLIFSENLYFRTRNSFLTEHLTYK